MEFGAARWVPAESKSALAAILGNYGATLELETADPNTWGYFLLPSDRNVVVGYANVGLTPALVASDDNFFIGINELLVGFDQNTFKRIFTYRMPTIFHEFLSSSSPIVARDELGFVSVSISGKERWRHMTSGPIEKFTMANGWLRGETIDGERFSFPISG